jgi:hypothetical protein
MTSTRPDTVAQSAAVDRAQTFVDWTRINAKLLTTGAVVVAVAAAGYWFYLRSTQIQATNAERALLTAKQSMTAGNLPLAQKDLQNVYAKYASTSAGVQAGNALGADRLRRRASSKTGFRFCRKWRARAPHLAYKPRSSASRAMAMPR